MIRRYTSQWGAAGFLRLAVVLGLVVAGGLTLITARSVPANPDSQQTVPPPRSIPFPFVAGPESRPQAPGPGLESAVSAPAVASGTWTSLSNRPPFGAQGSFLLTDGRVLVQDAQLFDVAWWTLTPDSFGSYINGTWNQVASPPNCPNGYPGASADTVYSPLYYASAVLPDGRFIVIGGEYNYNYHYVPNTGFEVWTNQGAIYDPVANSWACVAPPSGWDQIGDAQSVVLPDGTFMIAYPLSGAQANQVATLNTGVNPPVFNNPITPTGKTADEFNDEEGWELLANGNVLTLEVWNANDDTKTPALTYSALTQAWSSAADAPDPLVDLNLREIGPAILRPDGTVFASGATGFTNIYNTTNDTWMHGPNFPTVTDTVGNCNNKTEQLVSADGPASAASRWRCANRGFANRRIVRIRALDTTHRFFRVRWD